MVFKNKTVIITGGSAGVGAATARLFAAAGANLMLVARGKKQLEEVAEELRDQTRVEIMAMDVADQEACASLFKKARFEFEGVHILINNAGQHVRGRVDSVDADELGKMIDVNLRAPVILSRLALPYIRESGGGAIINVGSLAGRTPVSGAATYSASKAGLRAFTYALADEIKKDPIKLAVVSPGPVDTGFIMADLEIVADVTFSQPMSTADEVAAEILKLCTNARRERSMSPASGFMTTVMYLFPWLRNLARPLLDAKGRRVKNDLRAKLIDATREAK